MEKNNNYIELINRFWKQSAEKPFNTSDCSLYFYLLNTCNTLSWKQPFGQSDRYLSLMLGISVPTVRKAKCRLKQRGLITILTPTKKSKALDGQTKYRFPQSDEQTKIDATLPYSTAQFAQAWSKLIGTTRWRDKSVDSLKLTLKKLKEFDEEFAIQLIEKATEGGWNGLIFPETKQKYKQWKNDKNKQQQSPTSTRQSNESQHRKAEIIRLATAAITASHN